MSTALVIVDVQPTFCEGGELPVTGGNATAEAMPEFLRTHRSSYDLLVTTQDWHVDPGAHFSDDPDYVDSWPPHGLAGTANAELHPAVAPLLTDGEVVHVRKGLHAPAYSGFDGATVDGQSLAEVLAAAGVEAVDVVGIALSHCVRDTALDAAAAGLRTRVLEELTVPVSRELGDQAVAAMRAVGVDVVAGPARA